MTDLFAALLARPEKTPGADVFGPLVRRATAAAAVAVLLVCQGLPAVAGERTRQPNVVFILADDLGYGDVSCYGQENWKTPNIDRLAAEGMRFTQFYAGATVCSPSRSCLMTGLHTGNTQVRGNRRPEPGLPADAVTVAEVLSEAGYACGAFGKWGLGLNGSAGAPLEQGFDRYFGHTSQMLAHNYFPYTLWEDRTVFDVEANAGTARGGYSAELIYEQSLNFIRDNADRPFFCYIPTTIPHAEMAAPERLVAKFRGKFGPETPYEGARPGHPRFRIGGYEPCAEPKATYAAMIAYLDEHVGAVVDTLDELGLTDDTLVIFTSDNGPAKEGGAAPANFNSSGGLRGYKRDLYEGGIRVPFIAKWPGRIEAGAESDFTGAFWDMMPTLAELAGSEAPEGLDGVSFVPTLTGEGTQAEPDYLYWEFHDKGGRVALRRGDWKVVRYNALKQPNAPVELYNVVEDPFETNDVARQYGDLADELTALMESARTESDVFPFTERGRAAGRRGL